MPGADMPEGWIAHSPEALGRGIQDLISRGGVHHSVAPHLDVGQEGALGQEAVGGSQGGGLQLPQGRALLLPRHVILHRDREAAAHGQVPATSNCNNISTSAG